VRGQNFLSARACKLSIVASLLAAALLPSAVFGRPKVILTEDEISTICAILPQTDLGFVSSGDAEVKDQAVEKELRERALVWKELPKKIRCGTKKVRLSSSGYGNFIDSFSITPDKSFAALSGGWLAAPLLGGGGFCVFHLVDNKWVREGCVHTWDS
jgi:hypothetical protein